ncbi:MULTISPECIES: cupin domain-containing protein [unclassified Amycolatopsis]|uniref:cupin domain-containing protein n=1 Tax=unclassified Amycolatopsis TaxID=2618356 RepID=UPI002E0FD48D|nr:MULTISPECIES: cupin domain-containing protein [unclassified Amycolatopsis]WSK79034.1 cupin domain-containing protein [Amycolatopsis sp. NBC_01286]
MRKPIAVTTAALAALLMLPATASATPGSGVTGTILSQKTIGHTDYTLREITIQPGGYTGWHFHDGTLYAYVKAGTLTHNLADCSLDGRYRTGQAFTERPDQVHIGRNLGTTPMVLEVLYVLPAGSPLSEDAPNPGCGF